MWHNLVIKLKQKTKIYKHIINKLDYIHYIELYTKFQIGLNK